MSDAQMWMLFSPTGREAAVVIAVLTLSVLGPPWIRAVGRDESTPSLFDRWKLFSFLHPVAAALLRWTGAVTIGAAVSVAALVLIDRHDVVAHVQQAAAETLHRVWKQD